VNGLVEKLRLNPAFPKPEGSLNRPLISEFIYACDNGIEVTAVKFGALRVTVVFDDRKRSVELEIIVH